jgi:hypothetical protein
MRHATLCTALLLVAVASCSDEPRQPVRGADTTVAGDRGDTDAARDSTSDSTVATNLPSGRFQLPTKVTPAPDLWMTLPEGYRVKGASRLPDDIFFIVHTEDPGLEDSTAVTPGFMRVYVGPRPQRPFGGMNPTPGERVVVAGYPLQWRHIVERLPDGREYLQRDLGSADFFARFSPDLADTPLHLHVYVAGTDAKRVEALMKAAESISIVP